MIDNSIGTALRASVALQLDEQTAREIHAFYLSELAFMHVDNATDNILRRGMFAPGAIGDPARYEAKP